MAEAIDLLYEAAATRVSLPLIERALVFAFSAGDTAGAFERALENAGCGESCFAPECFAQDLFIDHFIDRCVPIVIKGKVFTPCKPYLRRLLTRPPKAAADTCFRQRTLDELRERPEFRRGFEELYTALQELRTLLSSGDYSSRIDQNLRRLDILKSLAAVFTNMANNFEGSASALRRIRDAGQRITSSQGFIKLAELLEHERHMSTVDLRLKLGVDGGVRSFTVVRYSQNPNNSFHVPLLKRIWGRLMLMLRGHHITQHELMSRLLDQAFEGVKTEVLPVFQLLGDMEFYLSGLGMADMARRAGLQTCFAEIAPAGSGARFEAHRLYNPFLLAEGVDVRPCDIGAADDAIVVVTGPNSGGKTRLLQSVALCQLLAQSGLMVPAQQATVVWTQGLFVSLLDDVTADQEEGRLGMELMRIRRLFEQINVGDMVVIDELCSGTNPSEGEEIFRLVLQLLGELRPRVWLTTHFLSFAERLKETTKLDQLHFLQVMLDSHDVPTFEFCEGVAKTSLARQTAARLGVTGEELTLLVERAKMRHHKGAHSLPPPATEERSSDTPQPLESASPAALGGSHGAE